MAKKNEKPKDEKVKDEDIEKSEAVEETDAPVDEVEESELTKEEAEKVIPEAETAEDADETKPVDEHANDTQKEETEKHVVTEEDLKDSPDLQKDGVKVGDEIKIEEPDPIPEAETNPYKDMKKSELEKECEDRCLRLEEKNTNGKMIKLLIEDDKVVIDRPVWADPVFWNGKTPNEQKQLVRR